MAKNLFLTGPPGVGKTGIIIEALADMRRVGGFYTREMRTGGVRQGFEIITTDGKSAILAHVDIHSPYRVSKYRVDLEALEKVGVAAIREGVRERNLVIIDEVGKMELLSPSFRSAVLEAMKSDSRVLGTIMLKSHPWADEIKRRPDTLLLTVTRGNRQETLYKIQRWLEAQDA